MVCRMRTMSGSKRIIFRLISQFDEPLASMKLLTNRQLLSKLVPDGLLREYF